MQYRRAKIKGGTYFFTLVTHKRHKILCEPDNVPLLREIVRSVKANHPFTIDAFVLLPDHLHCIWTLPEGDCDFSTRWRLIKSEFSRRCHPKYKQQPSASRQRKKEQAVWQQRFWEHLIRDETDFTQHVEYIHYNPVKHGLVRTPRDWEFSSFHRYIRDGLYDRCWGEGEEIPFLEGIGNE
jgi:putative transposase